MAIMGKILEFLGFEGNSKKEKVKPRKKEKVKATYNFKKKQKVEKIDNIDGVRVVYPEIMDDCKKYIDDVRKKEPLIVSIEYCQKEEIAKVIAYATALIEAYNGKFVELEVNRYYILLPEDMEIEE